MIRNKIVLGSIILSCVIGLSIAVYLQFNIPASAKNTINKPKVVTQQDQRNISSMERKVYKSNFLNKVSEELKTNGYRPTGAATFEYDVNKKTITILLDKNQKITGQKKEDISNIVNNVASKNKLGSFIVKTQYVQLK
ncbi:hypothetical protein [Terrilactibacillus laevilacticus]|uniref:Uncharacterized protein n=1 Tax=Terrilactibacillus laevilacticus TaxID=1380157 RepID=A0ABW5PUN8_9BACI|nr:hypothetical protein [Terrilactibacillus laevilacticus]